MNTVYFNQPVIILVKPQMAENVGMTARAMMNCGLYNLRLVCAREDHLSQTAVRASSGAEKILQNAKVYSSTVEAIADLTDVYATTARRRNQIKTIFTAEKAASDMFKNIKNEAKCGILFGPERTGLENDDISLAKAIVEIPLNPEHTSLNLSQAVLLVGYEWFKTQINVAGEEFVTNATHIATNEQLMKFFDFLESKLTDYKNLADEQKKPTLLRNLHNIFTRNKMTEQELNSLYGIINHLSLKNK
ncbi:MAG: RNA methyltransferase [Alphaproteobacteria bacterium]|nr:RNA methyltransferase [Alphaproteobacteria bacterium]